jgi:hypothetical protein
MKPRKTKLGEPSLRDKLGDAFMQAFEADFATHGVSVIERLRESHPEKYVEVGAKLIATAEQPLSPGDFSRCETLQDIGRQLLRQVGMDEYTISDELADKAAAANARFVDELELIAAQAEH